MGHAYEAFGPYRLLARLGAGGMAETFVAVRHGIEDYEQEVCIKRILSHLEGDPEFVALFLREARLSARLGHSNIARVIDFGVIAGQHYLALELIDGTDLRTLLAGLARDEQRLTSGLVIHIAVELARALDFAWRGHGVVHRDISPSNVLVSEAGEIKLADFGIAKALGHRLHTQTARARGKLPYMAPEYARHGYFDLRSDLFSLGVMLYECLAGRRPYIGRSPEEILYRISSGAHEDLARLVPGADPAVVAAVHRLIAPHTEHRFATVAAFLDALAEVPPPPTARRILGRLVQNYRPVRTVDARGTVRITPRVIVPAARRERPPLSRPASRSRTRAAAFVAGMLLTASIAGLAYLVRALLG